MNTSSLPGVSGNYAIKSLAFPLVSDPLDKYFYALSVGHTDAFFSAMKPNVYEYPTNESELPAYRVAVMQAALEGGQVELRRRGSFMYGPWRPVDADPAWNWGEADYRIVRPKARYFRKPGGLFGPTSDPSEQYCVRMIDGVCAFVDVSGGEDVDSALTRAIVEGHVSTGHWIEFDGDMTPWKPKAPPVSPVSPVSPVAAGHNPRKLTEEQVGKGYRLLTEEEMKTPRREGVQYWSNFWGGWDEPLSRRDSHCGLDTYRTSLPAGKYAPSPVAPGHNPEGLTVEQIGEGYRTLTLEEVRENRRRSNSCDPAAASEAFDIELWDGKRWTSSCSGDTPGITYRTKKPPGFYLPKPKIAEGHNPAGVTEDQIPAGWRLFSAEEFQYLTSSDQACEIPGTRCRTGTEWSEVDAWGLYDTSPDGTLITDKPAGFYLPKPKVLKPWSLTTLRWPDCIRRKGRRAALGVLTSTLFGLRAFDQPAVTAVEISASDIQHVSWRALLDDFEASFDHGQTWVPCGTEEDAL